MFHFAPDPVICTLALMLPFGKAPDGGVNRCRRFARSMFVASCALLATSVARADTVWFRAPAANVAVGKTLELELFRSRSYGADPQPVHLGALRRLISDLDGRPVGFDRVLEHDDAMKCTLHAAQAGVLEIVADFQPIERTLPAIAVEGYLRELHATDDVRAAWSDLGSGRPWKERRHERVTTYVRIGDTTTAPAARPPVAQGCDLQPISDPTRAVLPAPFVVRVFRDGQPVSDCVVEFVSLGGTRQHVTFSGADGRAAATLEVAGPWLIQTTELRRVQGTERDWEADRAALTLFVP